ncbi:MAG: Methionine synthase [Thermoanaerobacterales bacterium 50_218]|nr:MAG: Methionine synthase [Thermoanaerobacterales bacterium 50_218]
MGVQSIFDAVISLDSDKVVELVKEEIGKGTDVSSILEQGLIAAMDEVGKRFSEGQFFVPEMLLAAQAMKAGIDVLRPYLIRSDSKSKKGTVVIGTVKGDLHDIGKNLVAMMLEGAGFEVHDLGVDVDTDTFVNAAKEKNADIVAMSALLTTTMPTMEEVIKAIKENQLKCKTMVGGAPVTQAFASRIGADGYSEDAPGAVEKARELLGL